MKPVDFTNRARSDFLWLVEYLYAPRALELIEAWDSVTQDLREHPELGELEDDGRTRLLRRSGYRFYYVDQPDRVSIVRVIDPQGPNNRP